MSVTIYDVAREANVSMATVSRVVNGNQNVKPATRKKVLDCIERLGYRPNAVARGLASKKTTTIGVIVPDISKSYYAELSRGIADIATMYEYNIILSNSDKRPTREVELFEDHLGKQVDGVIFMSDSLSDEIRKEMATANVPVVLAGTLDAGTNLPTVNIDHEDAAYQAVKKLIENGHKRIAYVSGPLSRDINRLCKKVGYEKALKEANLPLIDEYFIETNNTYDDAYEKWKLIRDLDERPTGIFAGNDEIAVGIMNGLRDDGLSVPDDIEMICFQHTLLSRVVRPQLSAVVVPLYDLGAVSMRLLTKLMNGEEVDDVSVILPHRIEERQSTK
ncbi:catabolite control protein A [Sporosarcina thermotolerans]|uniref:Catabolite control protein A n=1 Tax=Sporosarcina thermotolerans TaxID=633404 RepID=A0AAW9AAD6_9BACL|nr:catabolite control protein A [Sporosarcina thermotolerans]MDW0117154.1 catabolite control protein A [Sporosarcina thermotolerans]WHT47768.1 catabolite control protein A [Sporosarcina thermotolerans]